MGRIASFGEAVAYVRSLDLPNKGPGVPLYDDGMADAARASLQSRACAVVATTAPPRGVIAAVDRERECVTFMILCKTNIGFAALRALRPTVVAARAHPAPAASAERIAPLWITLPAVSRKCNRRR